MKFWNFQTITNESEGSVERIVELRIDGDIVDDDSAWLYEWFDINHTSPNAFRSELRQYDGQTMRVVIDSFGGDIFAGFSIYNDLRERSGKTIGVIHSKAMSSASVIAMGCDRLDMAPTAILMIHDPLTGVYGNISDFEQILQILNTIKDGIINAYQTWTSLSRQEISDMMTNETWMSAHEAVRLGFASSVIDGGPVVTNSLNFNRNAMTKQATNGLLNMIELKKKQTESKQKEIELLKLELDFL